MDDFTQAVERLVALRDQVLASGQSLKAAAEEKGLAIHPVRGGSRRWIIAAALVGLFVAGIVVGRIIISSG